MKIIFFTFLLSLSLTLSSTGQDHSDGVPYDVDTLPILKEAFHTERDEYDNVDSPAVWHGENGENWLLATAKEGHSIIIYDAEDGSFIKRYGQQGIFPGEFDRPNGIAVIDDLMLVVERDNARVQVVQLPDMKFIGMMADEDLRYPYGLTVEKIGEGSYDIYITDNYNPAFEGYPLEEQLDERIHHYRFSVDSNGNLEYETIRLFGEISGDGILHKVESLYMDRLYGRLLIADEAYSQRNIKLYTLEGEYTGEVIPNIFFTSEPEGIVLYSCADGSGYWIITDQHKSEENKFQIFDRESLEYIGGFRAEITRNTDGIWLTQKAFGDFPKGAFYPVHDDGSITAISWEDISEAVGLQRDCTF
jgi:3-phytase